MFKNLKTLNDTAESSLKEINDKDKELLLNVIKEIKNNNDAKIFCTPVDEKENFEYLKIIGNHPMDFSTIENNLLQNKYILIKDVINDIKLIWNNCRIYNQENSDIYNKSIKLEKEIDEFLLKSYYYNTESKVDYQKEFEKNVYIAEAFSDPDYFEHKKSFLLNEKEGAQQFSFIYYKVKLMNLLKILSKEKRKIFFDNILENKDQRLNFLIEKIEKDDKNKSIKFHIENLNKQEINDAINYIEQLLKK